MKASKKEEEKQSQQMLSKSVLEIEPAPAKIVDDPNCAHEWQRQKNQLSLGFFLGKSKKISSPLMSIVISALSFELKVTQMLGLLRPERVSSTKISKCLRNLMHQ